MNKMQHAEVEQEDEESLEVCVHTQSGKVVELTHFNAADIDLEDIAHSLSMQCRYNGHTREFYSVAEHCVLLANYVLQHPEHGKATYTKPLAKLMLLHDASEAYMGDIVRPLKEVLYAFDVLEEFVSEQIRSHYGLSQDNAILYALIKALDTSICVDEISELIPTHMATVEEMNASGIQALGVKIQCWSPKEARAEFLKLAKELGVA